MDTRAGLRPLLCAALALLTLTAVPCSHAQPEGGAEAKFFGGPDDPNMPRMPQPNPAERQALQMDCQSNMQEFVQRNSDMVKKHTSSPASNPEDMLFFLHVPRTAGRTFFSCFLKPALPPSRRCAKSYDLLRLNVSMSGCGLLSSHDDYSVAQFLPETSAIITQVRDPVDRVLSAYEFSIEVAARELKRPPNRPVPPPGKVNTRNVWPWSLLVPWMEADMRERARRMHEAVKANQAEEEAKKMFQKIENKTTGTTYYHNFRSNTSKWELDESDTEVPPLDPYFNPTTMPLREFIEHPLVRDTIHNGGTLQTLGLTNYSHLPAAFKLRQCVEGLPNAKEAMTKAALSRLSTMYHVGVTDQLSESITSAAAALGLKLAGHSWSAKTDGAFSYDDPNEREKAKDGEAKKPVEAGGAADDAIMEERKAAFTVRITELNEEMEEKSKALRKVQASIRTSQHKLQTVSASGADGRLQSEMEQHRADADRLHREIDATRAQVADLQVQLVKLKTPAPQLPKNAAKQLKDDDSMRNPVSLQIAYHKCVAGARAKNARRWMPLKNLRTPDGRTFYYSYAARKALHPSIIHRIRELNSMDVRLYAAATKMLKEARERQEAAGTLEELPPVPKGLQAIDTPPLLPHPPPQESDGQDVLEDGAGKHAGSGAGEGLHQDAQATGDGHPAENGASGAAARQGLGQRPGGARQQQQQRRPQQQQQNPNGPRRPVPGPSQDAAGPGLNRAPRGPEARGQRRRRPNPDAVVDAHRRDEL